MEKAISELMAADNIAYGRFTRTYLRYLSNPELTDTHESRQLMVLSLAMPDEPMLRKCWRKAMRLMAARPALWYATLPTVSGYPS